MNIWSEVMRKNPEKLNTFVEKEIDGVKKAMALSYFDHESSDLKNWPYLWFDDVTLAYKNILVGNNMQETRSILTGLTTSVHDWSQGTIITNMISVSRNIRVPTLWPQKYTDYESAMQNLNSTSCFDLAFCHQIRMKVSTENLTDKDGHIIVVIF